MGTDVIIMMQGHEIVNLGNVDRYKTNEKIPKEDELYDIRLEEILRVKRELQSLSSYTPKSLEELRGLKDIVDDIVDNFSEAMLKIGRQSVLINILSDNNLTCKFK